MEVAAARGCTARRSQIAPSLSAFRPRVAVSRGRRRPRGARACSFAGISKRANARPALLLQGAKNALAGMAEYSANYEAKPATSDAPAAPPADGEEIDHEGFGMSDVLLDSVTKDEWKSIEMSLSHTKKTVAEMLKRACSQIRQKGELVVDESNGKFVADMLPEMEDFAVWCYKNHIRPKLIDLLPIDLDVDDVEAAGGDKKKKGGGGKPGAGGGKKGGGGKGKDDKVPAKTQIKIDNVMRIMNGNSAKDSGKKTSGLGNQSVGWLEALEPGKNLVVDAPWELQLAKEMGTAAGLLSKREKGVVTKEESEEARYRNVRNLADAIVIFESQYKIRFGKEPPPLQLLADARFVLDKLKTKTKFTVSKCLRKHSHLLSSSQFKSRHAMKFLQPYGTQTDLFKSISKPGPRLVLLRSPPDTGKTSMAPSMPELFPSSGRSSAASRGASTSRWRRRSTTWASRLRGATTARSPARGCAACVARRRPTRSLRWRRSCASASRRHSRRRAG